MNITDEMLKQAAAEAMDAMMKALPEPEECQHEFSPEFERKMQKLIRKARHYTAHKIMNRVACILLVIALAGSSVLVVNVEARKAFFGWFENRFEEFYHYFFAGQEDQNKTDDSQEQEQLKTYSLGWLPDGYSFMTSFNMKNGKTMVYSKDTREMIQFSYINGVSDISKASSLFFGEGEYERKRVSVKDHVAEIYFAKDEKNSNVIVWADIERNVMYAVFAHLDELDLVKMAENSGASNE